MKGQEAGVMAPTGNIKYFVSYFIVFAVVAVLIVNQSESRDSNPAEQLTIQDPSTTSDEVVYVDELVSLELSSLEKISAFEFLFSGDQDIEEEEPDADISENLSAIDDPGTLYYPIILEASRRYQVDPLLVKAMIEVESGFNPNAVSHVGAQGLMQLMPSTAKYLGVEDTFNPEHNINGGVKYLKKLLDRFNGDIRLALAAYNAGSRKVRKYRGVPPFSETKNYIEKVFKLHTDYKKSQSKSVKAVFITQS